MTLIFTLLHPLGIVHAADSNLTTRRGGPAVPGRKIFRVPKLKAGVSIGGVYEVRGTPMSEWLSSRISEFSADETNAKREYALKSFASWLGSELEQNMTAYEKKIGSWFHIAGFERGPDGIHPALYILGNVRDIDPSTGRYIGFGEPFKIRADFWGEDCSTEEQRASFYNGSSIRYYFNGFPPGRIAYSGVMNQVLPLFLYSNSIPGSNFRPPETIADMRSIVKHCFQMVHSMFKMSTYSGPPIGGRIQTLTLHALSSGT